jgi:glucose-6-phosphate isomerase
MRFIPWNIPKTYNAEIIRKVAMKIQEEIGSPFSTSYSSISLPYQTSTEVFTEENNIHLIIWIGWSNLGTRAITDALKRKIHQGSIYYYLDTVDIRDIQETIDNIRIQIHAWKKIRVYVISKSWTTIETIWIFEYIFDAIIEENRSLFEIVIISDEWTVLHELSIKEHWTFLPIPKHVGWRYSVFSNVWIAPIIGSGIDPIMILAWARKSIEDFLETPGWHMSTILAHLHYEEYTKGRNIVEHFFFGKNYENLWKWYRQLLAESIWKEINEKNSVWLTPSTSIWTIDLHSVSQLDLAHSKDKIIHLVWIHSSSMESIGWCPFESIVPWLRWKKMIDIMEAAFIGFWKAIGNREIPRTMTILEEDSEFDIGYYMQSHMIEMILLWELFWVNPFNQPNVEEYKIWMREYLNK